MSKKSSKPLADELKPYVAPFRYDGSGEFHLKSHKTNEKGGLDKDGATEIIEANRERLNDFQEKLYAQDRWSLLLIFQGMDAAGKDSAIKSVFEGVNPQGCEVTAFKQPSTKELDHDFLWRSMVALPERGHIGIFNRSHYEECLVVRVHPEILAKQKLPPKLVTKDIWRDRFEDISAMERYLARNGIVILKFFLNVSKEEQRERFLERLEEPAKNWKFSMADIGERKLWDKYQAAYQDLIRHTSTKHAPWHIVPADHKWFARVVIGSAIVARSTGSTCISRKSTRPIAVNSSRCARRCWLRRRVGRRQSDGRVARMSAAICGSVASVLRLARPSSPRGRHRRLRALCDKFFVQPATAVVAPPDLSAHQPAGYAASRHDDPLKMPGGWFGRAPLQSELADVDGCKTDRCHADPLGSSCPLQASPTAGISAPPHHDRGPRRDREK